MANLESLILWLGSLAILYVTIVDSNTFPIRKDVHHGSSLSTSSSSALSNIPNYSTVRRKPLDKSKLKYIEIGGLFAMNGTTGSGWLGGQGCLPAAMMALEDVNNNEDLLAGYYLNITWNNSQV